MSESKEEVVSIESRFSHDPRTGYRRLPDSDISEGEDDEETRSVSPYVNRSAPDLHSPDDTNHPCLDRPRVRFRSRVRISTGIGGRRRRFSEGLSSNASSISGSPSSSISAPLRTHYTGGNNGWGPLGTRVSLLASQAAVSKTPRRDLHKSIGGDGFGDRDGFGDGFGDGDRNENARNGHHREGPNARGKTTRRSNSWTFIDDDQADERTHLMTSAQRRRAAANGYAHDWYYDDGERERRWRDQLVDETYGKWPERLFNRHWWWWQLEPIVCCFCICGDLDEGE